MKSRSSLDDIIEIVCEVTGVNENALVGRSRLNHEVEARHIFCSIALQNKYTLNQTAKRINRTHGTVIHSRYMCNILYEIDSYFRLCYDRAKQLLEDHLSGLITLEKDVLFDPKTGKFGSGINAKVIIKYHENNNI